MFRTLWCFVFLSLAASAGEMALDLPETVDLGDVKSGESATKTVIAVNRGKKPVQIERVRTSCGCTAVSFPKDPIAPQGKAQIQLKFSAGSSPGLKSKTVYVFLKGDGEAQSLKLKAKVIPNPSVATKKTATEEVETAPASMSTVVSPTRSEPVKIVPRKASTPSEPEPQEIPAAETTTEDSSTVASQPSFAVPRAYRSLFAGSWLHNSVWLWIPAIFAPNFLLVGLLCLRRSRHRS